MRKILQDSPLELVFLIIWKIGGFFMNKLGSVTISSSSGAKQSNNEPTFSSKKQIDNTSEGQIDADDLV